MSEGVRRGSGGGQEGVRRGSLTRQCRIARRAPRGGVTMSPHVYYLYSTIPVLVLPLNACVARLTR
eukprot:1018026-Prorocentrum_minimum.AAC.1